LKRKDEQHDDSKETVPEKRTRLERSSSGSRVHKEECMFGQKTKYKKETNAREDLILPQELRADITLREATTRKDDSRIISMTSRDIIAAAAH
jgi:hypothetical protein